MSWDRLRRPVRRRDRTIPRGPSPRAAKRIAADRCGRRWRSEPAPGSDRHRRSAGSWPEGAARFRIRRAHSSRRAGPGRRTPPPGAGPCPATATPRAGCRRASRRRTAPAPCHRHPRPRAGSRRTRGRALARAGPGWGRRRARNSPFRRCATQRHNARAVLGDDRPRAGRPCAPTGPGGPPRARAGPARAPGPASGQPPRA